VYRSRPVSLVLVGLFVWVTACHSYTQIEPGEIADHGKARVTLDDGSRFVVAHPEIEADSLVGFKANSWDRRHKVYTDSVRVALEQVGTLEASHASAGKTVGLVVGVIAGVFLVAGVACAASDCMDMELGNIFADPNN
jgi:hypothetical protein